jgi:uncharacterized membrane protein
MTSNERTTNEPRTNHKRPDFSSKEQIMSQLVVMTFDGVDTAGKVRKAVGDAAKRGLLKVNDAAVIYKEADGTVKVDNEVSSTMWAGIGIGSLLGVLVSFAFPLAGLAVGAAGGAAVAATLDRAVDKKFVEDVRNDLKPGGSALFLLGTGDLAALRGTLEPFEGVLYQTTLDSSAEQQIRDALK